jgi:hypothetical protein
VDSVQRWRHAPARLRVGYHPIALRFVGEADEVSIGPKRQKVLIIVSGLHSYMTVQCLRSPLMTSSIGVCCVTTITL